VRLALAAVALLAVGCSGPADDESTDAPTVVEYEVVVHVSPVDGADLVEVPGGELRVGDARGAFDERPVHTVRLSPFWIDRTEVTNARFEAFVGSSEYEPVGPWKWASSEGAEAHPVRFVTWHDAAAYCAWAGRALPTEAQWELAARGVDGRTWPWGSDWSDDAARTGLDADAGPADVGSHPAGVSPYGAEDLAGNVWEWVADWYDRYAYEAREARGVVVDPTGPEDGAEPEARFVDSSTAAGNERSTRKVIRGGGWAGPGPEMTRAARRTWGNPGYWLDDTGFRCATTPQEEP